MTAPTPHEQLGDLVGDLEEMARAVTTSRAEQVRLSQIADWAYGARMLARYLQEGKSVQRAADCVLARCLTEARERGPSTPPAR